MQTSRLVPKKKISKKLKYMQDELFRYAKKYNFYTDFGGYLDPRSCTAYLVLKRMLKNTLEKYSDEDRDSDDWDNIVKKERDKLISKYFIAEDSGRIENIIDWLAPKYQLYRSYPTLKVKTFVKPVREPRKNKKDLVRRFMFVYKGCSEAVDEIYQEFKEVRHRIIARGKKNYYKNQEIYNFPRRLEMLNRDVWLQPTTIKAMKKIMEYETPQTHFIKYNYSRFRKDKEERIAPSEVKQIMEDINGECY